MAKAPDGKERRVTFQCVTEGYESRVVLDASDPDAAEGLAEWLRWQLNYLKAIKPGDRVEISGHLKQCAAEAADVIVATGA